ncbi:TIGR01244 family phosphatase [Pusillimonas sp. MFBS29]|uniref:TIGR01244 family sulfur transferase n=1 Tax=Pusillimonas sp. MFBS29 TaxID=2886690 RepID=UPI001D0FE988|nr:TIGR01244 family sulfur transferase [Pusillimonas sp. MFBS29]MCC2594825.1 TIGR01244 family phosphatase [Pusillimonas sp. MFBS29]
MSVPINALTEDFAVAPQLAPEDMQAVADAGFRSVIINRPDMEGGPDQPLSSEVMAAAHVAGLEVVYQPVVSGAMTADDVVLFAKNLKSLPAPVLAFCRTGTRCTYLFQAASAL